ncbi:hypothetical protein MNBD_GAMMA08-3052 [hydrothermal vent metagenome]|uniref:Uncharacterized protein n=1 Tax=hydrothermal vent metagenome TaxID=652676 RepID=A0A3B0X8M4_9ZZZZ
MNNHISRYLACLLATVSLVLASCNNLYIKVDESPPLIKVDTRYTEIHQSAYIPRKVSINFTRNGHTAAIYSSAEIRFFDLDNNQLIKEIRSPEQTIIYGESSKDGNRYVLIINRIARILNTQHWTSIAQFKLENGPNDPNFSDNGQRLYIARSLWNIETGKKITEGASGISIADSDFSDNNQYFILADQAMVPTLIDMPSGKRLTLPPQIHNPKQTFFQNNNAYYIDYGTPPLPYTETLGLFSIEPQAQLAEITPYEGISCWTRLKDDPRIIMSLNDGDVLVLDEKLNVLDHWSIGRKALKCIGGTNARVWLAAESVDSTASARSFDIYEIDINKKTIAQPITLKGIIEDFAVSPDGKYIALINGLPTKVLARIYLNQ